MLCMSTLFLAHCSFSGTPKDAPTGEDVAGAKAALFWTQQLLGGTIAGGKVQPAGLLGSYVAHYLAGGWQQTITAGQAGIQAALMLLGSDQQSTDASFALLQQLGSVMQVEVPDLLNRASDRQQTLDAYTLNLEQLVDRCKKEQVALEQQGKTLQATRSEQRSKVNTIQRDLNTALRAQDYTTASSKQQEIVTAQGDLAKTESQIKQINSTINIFDDLTKIGDERVSAIKANREVLIAGLQVVSVPGIDDLGVLKNSKR